MTMMWLMCGKYSQEKCGRRQMSLSMAGCTEAWKWSSTAKRIRGQTVSSRQ